MSGLLPLREIVEPVAIFIEALEFGPPLTIRGVDLESGRAALCQLSIDNAPIGHGTLTPLGPGMVLILSLMAFAPDAP